MTTTELLVVRWDRTVIHPDDPRDDTIVCCLAEDGRPVALFLDDELREALGLVLVDPTDQRDFDIDRDPGRVTYTLTDTDPQDGRPAAPLPASNATTPPAQTRDDAECDGATRRGTRNCEETAVWELYIPDETGGPSQACGQHLNQVATYLLDGEQGDLDIRRIPTVER